MPSIAAKNMVQHQVHTWDMLDKPLLMLMEGVDRQRYVHPDYHGVAYSEGAVKAINGTLMQPAREIGRMLEVLAINQTDSVAIVGPESGYVAELVSQLSQHVTWYLPKATAEITPVVAGVKVMHKDLLNEWQQDGPFDVIIVLGALPAIPPSFLAALRLNGRLWSVIKRESGIMAATLTWQPASQAYSEKRLFETLWPKLPGAQWQDKFSL